MLVLWAPADMCPKLMVSGCFVAAVWTVSTVHVICFLMAKFVTLNEVSEHNKAGDAWIILDGKVLEDFKTKHSKVSIHCQTPVSCSY